MTASGELWRDSAICIHVSILSQTPLPPRLALNSEQSSLCYTTGFCWLSILNIAVSLYICKKSCSPYKRSSPKARNPTLASVIKGHLVPVWPPTPGTANSFIREKALTKLNCLDVHFSSFFFFSFKIYITYSLTISLLKLRHIEEKFSLVFSLSKPYRYSYFDRTVSDGSFSEKIDGCRHEWSVLCTPLQPHSSECILRCNHIALSLDLDFYCKCLAIKT